MLGRTIVTALLFALFTIVIYYSSVHPIVGDISNDDWIMNITIISGNQTYRAIIYNTVVANTTTHIETIWSGNNTWVYTLTLTKTLTTTTTTSITQVTHTTITFTTTTTTSNSTTTMITTSTVVTTTSSTTTQPVTVAPPAKTTSIITATSKIVAFNWRSVVVWASIVYTDKTVIGYTTFFYK